MLQGLATPQSDYSSDMLSRRQADVVKLAAAGLTAKQTATRLGISRHTVNEYVQNAKRRIGASTKAELVAWAVASGMLSVDLRTILADRRRRGLMFILVNRHDGADCAQVCQRRQPRRRAQSLERRAHRWSAALMPQSRVSRCSCK